ncbi:SAF domain-containing protein [Corallococcus macrosporus]|uniref:SAF domain-containing protein n=1 Tax=Corallococcus macrosporus TaxID=35 RepID=A0ABS3DDL6_9BACT|nr:SAF domain-containing protein [Corallococcus macrosporus]MBN8228812.1 SAF domain-containing protein [Corallococcus macrosporus]
MSPFIRGIGVGLFISLLGAGLFGMAMTRKYLSRVDAAWGRQPVLVITHDIPPGHVLTAVDLTEARFPRQFLTDTWVLDADRAEVLGKAVTVAVEKDAPLLWSSFAAPSCPAP